MRYSLAARFRGTLLGAIAGHLAGSSLPSQRHLQPTAQDRVNLSLTPALTAPDPVIKCGIRGLRLVLSALAQGSDSLPWDQLTQELSPLAGSEQGLGFAIATLPLALYHHEAWEAHAPCLQEGAIACHLPREQGAIAPILALLLELAIYEELTPAQLPTQILANLSTIPADVAVVEQLQHLQHAIDRQCSMAIARHTLPNILPPLGLPSAFCEALYLVATSPYDPILLFQRLTHSATPGLTGLLAGALAGCLTGSATLQGFLETELRSTPTWLVEHWQFNALSEAIELMDQALAHWAGVYPSDPALNQTLDQMAIAPPNLVRR